MFQEFLKFELNFLVVAQGSKALIIKRSLNTQFFGRHFVRAQDVTFFYNPVSKLCGNHNFFVWGLPIGKKTACAALRSIKIK
jgi:hypothetical protein